ncbi:MAG TPA: dual specificity protein phosphatase family protein [Candidatus Acidoferrales bacterium]|nr:dual specificity protein phosphatase family protein [Candidatus Acidoferrales bacterium]
MGIEDNTPWPWGPPQRPSNRPNLDIILPELLIGEYPTPADAAWLRTTYGVTAVVNVQDDGDLLSKGLRVRDLEASYRAHGISFHRLPITDCDAEMLMERLEPAVALIDAAIRAGSTVYLHCNAGMNRAPTIAIAYLHVHRRLPLLEARDFVKARRQCLPYMSVLEARYLKR